MRYYTLPHKIFSPGDQRYVIVSEGLRQHLTQLKNLGNVHLLTSDEVAKQKFTKADTLIFLDPALTISDRKQLRLKTGLDQAVDGFEQVLIPAVLGSQRLLSHAKPNTANEGVKPVIILGDGGLEFDFFVEHLALAGITRARRYLDDLHLQWYRMGGNFSFTHFISCAANLVLQQGESHFAIALPTRILFAAEELGLIDIDKWIDVINRQKIPVVFHHNSNIALRAYYLASEYNIQSYIRWSQITGVKKQPVLSPKCNPNDMLAELSFAAATDKRMINIMASLNNSLTIDHNSYLTSQTQIISEVAQYLRSEIALSDVYSFASIQASYFKDMDRKSLAMLRQVVDELGLHATASGYNHLFQEVVREQNELSLSRFI